MASYAVRKGRLERDPGIDRGPMLVRSEEEWRIGHVRLQRRASRSVYIVYIALLALLILVQVALWTLAPHEPAWDAFGILLVGLTILIGLAVPLAWAQQMSRIEKAPTVGLYERGLQLNHQVFIPYDEIASTVRRTVKGGEVMEMRHRHVAKDPFWVRNPDPWGILVEFLGEDGAEELEARVAQADKNG